jgi:two-component system response regulator RegA
MSLKQRILIVDDDSTFTRVLTRAFRRRNFDAISVRDGEAALAAAKKRHPDFVVLDIRLAGEIDGIALIKPLKMINPSVRIVVLSGYARISGAVAAIKLGAANYMAKPVSVDEILVALEATASSQKEDNDVPCSEAHGLSISDIEWRHILGVLRTSNGNVSAAARELGMYRRTLQRKLAAHSVDGGKRILTIIRGLKSTHRKSSVSSTSR